MAALAATRTDAELKTMLVPELADRITACEEPFKIWFRRFRETGARFDSVAWARKACFFTRGSLTFREAYQRTGRILNISVIVRLVFICRILSILICVEACGSPQPDKTSKLSHCSRHCHMDRTHGFRCCSGDSQSCRANGEGERWEACSMELGLEVQGWLTPC